MPEIEDLFTDSRILSPAAQYVRYNLDIPFDKVVSPAVSLPTGFAWNNGTPVRYKSESQRIVQRRAEWVFFDNKPTQFDGMLMALLSNLNDCERVCPRSHPYERMQCAISCLECLIRNSTQDTHELPASLWCTCLASMVKHIFATKELRMVRNILRKYVILLDTTFLFYFI